MPVERAAGGTSLVDVLDRVLDKGIVIDAWVRVSLVGIDLITVEARVVVASIDTYLKYAEAVGQVGTASRPALEAPAPDVLSTETAMLDRDRVSRKTPVRAPRRKRPITT
jgi:gas vesicle structural protein